MTPTGRWADMGFTRERAADFEGGACELFVRTGEPRF
jgi:hypothetical protein